MYALFLIKSICWLETLLAFLRKVQPKHPDDTVLTPVQCHLLDAIWALDALPGDTPYKDQVMTISTILHATSNQLNTVRWNIVHERQADARRK